MERVYYRIYLGDINKVIVERETDKAVWINSRKCIKGKWQADLYDTFDDAKNELFERARRKREYYLREAENIVTEMNRISALKEDDNA